MRPVILALGFALLLPAGVASATGSRAGDRIELDLAQWRHPLDPTFAVVDDNQLLLDHAPPVAFRLAAIRREWAEFRPGRHGPAQGRMAAGRRP